MDNELFGTIVGNRVQKIKDTLCAKAAEYAHGDRLSNFRVAATLQGCTPEKALGGLVAKHIVALYDFINELESGNVREYAFWDEKIGDIQAYMCLLDALVIERLREKQ